MRRTLTMFLITATIAVGLGALQPAAAADAGAEKDFANRVNLVRASRGLPAVGTHSVLRDKARAWAQHMASSGCLCHSNLPDNVTVGWRKLGENIGRGPSVGSIHDALVNSPPHLANMVDPAFGWVGVGVAYGGGHMYVAQVFMDGDGPPGPNPLLAYDTTGRAIAARASGGFWTLAGNGVVHAYEGAPNYGSPRFPAPLARDIATMPDGNGYVILDGYGGVHRYGSAKFSLANVVGPYFGFDIARSIAVTPDGKGFAIIDGYGGYHRAGNAPRIRTFPYWRGWDIARSIEFSPSGGAYMLDGFGTVWSRGGAKGYGATYFGWDIARDLAPWPDGKGYAVIDGFGGVHRFGSAKKAAKLPYQQLDRWRSIVTQSGTYLAIRNDGTPKRV
jgi:hypothetical protein